MRDPANESELHRLRNELANLQIAYTDRETELAFAQATARKARERAADQTRAAMLKVEDEWRREERERLEAAKLEWERRAHLAAEMNAAPEAVSETATVKRANRLLLDSALAVGMAAIVMLGVTFYLRMPAGNFYLRLPAGTFYWRLPAGFSDASAALTPKAAPATAPAAVQNAVLPMTIGTSFARIRTAPTTSASVVTTLRHGVQVSLLERHGNWARVHVNSGGAKAAFDGWVFAASLQDSSGH